MIPQRICNALKTCGVIFIDTINNRLALYSSVSIARNFFGHTFKLACKTTLFGLCVAVEYRFKNFIVDLAILLSMFDVTKKDREMYTTIYVVKFHPQFTLTLILSSSYIKNNQVNE